MAAETDDAKLTKLMDQSAVPVPESSRESSAAERETEPNERDTVILKQDNNTSYQEALLQEEEAQIVSQEVIRGSKISLCLQTSRFFSCYNFSFLIISGQQIT